MAQRAQLLSQFRELEHIKLDGLRFRIIDAKGMVVGRLAAEIATILQGKDKPTFTPKQNMGDVVVVINAAHVQFTGYKWDTKLYRWHTGFPGGLKSLTASEMWEKDPTQILYKAVNGMLPKNRLRPFRMDKLKVFPEATHPFDTFDLVPHVPKVHRSVAPATAWQVPDGFVPMNREQYAVRAAGLDQFHRQQKEQEEVRRRKQAKAQAEALAAGGERGQRAMANKAAQGREMMGLAGFEQLLDEEERAMLKAALAKSSSSSSTAAASKAAAGGAAAGAASEAKPAGSKTGKAAGSSSSSSSQGKK